jgi:hypothetical protein
VQVQLLGGLDDGPLLVQVGGQGPDGRVGPALAQDPTPDWGLMVAEGQNYFTTAWWVVTFPGIAILVTAFAFNLIGDGLRDLLDPRRSLLP